MRKGNEHDDSNNNNNNNNNNSNNKSEKFWLLHMSVQRNFFTGFRLFHSFSEFCFDPELSGKMNFSSAC